MAFAATVEWEVRNGGNDANGGGFDPTSGTPGTDYSQQDAAQITYTDLVIDATTNTDCTSAGNPFTAAHVGNIVNITSGTGFTVQRVQVMSVTAGVARMDKSLGTLSSTGGNGKLGGGFASPGACGGLLVAGNIMWIKYHATDYSLTSTSNNVSNGRVSLPSGSATAPVLMRGYDTAHGDETANRPTLKWGVNAGGSYIVSCGVSYNYLENLILNGNRANFTNPRGASFASDGNRMRRVKIMGMTSLTINFGGGSICEWTDVELTDNTVVTGLADTTHHMIGIYAHDNTVGAFTLGAGTVTITDSIFDTNGATPFSTTGACRLIASNCTFYGNTGAGIDLTARPHNFRAVNCVFEANTTYGIKLAATYAQVETLNCAFYNNTSGKYNTGFILSRNITGEVIPTVSPFVNAGSADFRLNMISGGGAGCRGAGYPQTFPGLTWANRRDIGAHQHSGAKRGING